MRNRKCGQLSSAGYFAVSSREFQERFNREGELTTLLWEVLPAQMK